MEKFDLIVIGGGSGGVRAARRASALGVKTLLVECAQLGGTCVNVGCVPKKLFYYAAGFSELTRYAAAYGYPQAALGSFAWHSLLANKNAEIKRLNEAYLDLLQTAGVQLAYGEAQLQDAHNIQVNEQAYYGERILLACGGEPSSPALPGIEHAALSNDLFYLTDFPQRVVIVGAGYIALEFAGIFNGLGADTHLCYRAELPMRGLDDDIRQRLAAGIAAGGVTLHSGVSPERITAENGAKRLHLQGGDSLAADLVVFATGRKPRTAALNLAAAGIAVSEKGTIAVDENYRTGCASIYALGDLIDTPALTPVATAEAEAFVQRVLAGNTQAAVDYDAVPTAIFSRPGVALAGLSEAAAAKRGLAVTVQTAAFKPMKGAFAGASAQSYIKLIGDKKNGKVLGAQMIGEDAAEIMQGFAVAIAAGATAADFARTVGIHPTSAEEFVTFAVG